AGGARQRGPLAGSDRAARAGARVLEEVGVFMDHPNVPVALLLLVMTGLILGFIATARRRTLFIRRIPGLSAVEEAVGRAVEMGRPITFSLGLGGLDVVTLQALAVAVHVVRMAIRYGSRVILTMADPTIYAVSDEAV